MNTGRYHCLSREYVASPLLPFPSAVTCNLQFANHNAVVWMI